MLEGALRSVGVVVVDVVDHYTLELLAVPDDDSVEEFTPDRPDPAFGERVGNWRADRTLEDLESFGAEDLVERVDELAAPVTNERS